MAINHTKPTSTQKTQSRNLKHVVNWFGLFAVSFGLVTSSLYPISALAKDDPAKGLNFNPPPKTLLKPVLAEKTLEITKQGDVTGTGTPTTATTTEPVAEPEAPKPPPISKLELLAVDIKENKLILDFNYPVEASLIPTYHNQKRALLLDIKGANLEGLDKKDDLLAEVQKKLPFISSLKLSEFQGSNPVVRLFVQPSDANISGDLELTGAKTKVALKFISTGQQMQAALTDERPIIEPIDPAPLPSDNEILVRQAPEDTPKLINTPAERKPISERYPAYEGSGVKALPKKLIGKASSVVDDDAVSTYTYNIAIDQIESLRFERDQLASDVTALRKVNASQSDLIAKLRNEQQALLLKDRDSERKAVMEKIETELNNTQKSYEQVKRDYSRVENEMVALKEQLDLANSKLKNYEGTDLSKKEDTGYKAELVPSLYKLQRADIDQLVDAEKAYRDFLNAKQQGNAAEAEKKLSTAYGLAPQVPHYALHLSNIQLQQGKIDEAERTLQKTLKFQPGNSELLQELGKLAYRNGDMQAAKNYFSGAMPTNLLSNVATLYRRSGELATAEFVYKLAIDAQPNDSDLYYNLGTLYLSQKRYGDAKPYLKQALSLQPEFAQAYYQIGLVHAQSGHNTLAASAFEKYLQYNPEAANKSDVQEFIDNLKDAAYRPPQPTGHFPE